MASGGALANLAVAEVDTAHARVRGERHERAAQRVQIALAQVEALLGEHDDAAPLRRLVGERGELRGVGQLLFGDARRRE